MTPVVVIGDELSCAAWRLAGVPGRSPAPDELQAELARAMQGVALVILTRRLADTLQPEVLRRAVAKGTPPLAVLPDLVEPQADTAFVRRMRGLLGIEA